MRGKREEGRTNKFVRHFGGVVNQGIEDGVQLLGTMLWKARKICLKVKARNCDVYV